MECSQNDVINESTSDVVGIAGSDSEIYLDDVIYKTNETDVFNDLLTAISKSLSAVSLLETAMTEETVEQSLNAYADPSLNTRISLSTASELSDVQEYESIADPFYRATSPLQVWRNDEGRITGFEMMCDERKVKVVDSLECLEHDLPLEAVYFDPRVYLSIPYSEPVDFGELFDVASSNEEDDVSTASLGPTSGEFEDWLRDND